MDEQIIILVDGKRVWATLPGVLRRVFSRAAEIARSEHERGNVRAVKQALRQAGTRWLQDCRREFWNAECARLRQRPPDSNPSTPPAEWLKVIEQATEQLVSLFHGHIETLPRDRQPPPEWWIIEWDISVLPRIRALAHKYQIQKID